VSTEHTRKKGKEYHGSMKLGRYGKERSNLARCYSQSPPNEEGVKPQMNTGKHRGVTERKEPRCVR